MVKRVLQWNMFRWKPILSKIFYVVFNKMCEMSNEHHTTTRKLIWNMTKQLPEHICTKIKPNWVMFKWKKMPQLLDFVFHGPPVFTWVLGCNTPRCFKHIDNRWNYGTGVSFLVMMDFKSCGRNPSIFRQKQCAIVLCEYANPSYGNANMNQCCRSKLLNNGFLRMFVLKVLSIKGKRCWY